MSSLNNIALEPNIGLKTLYEYMLEKETTYIV